MAKSNNGIILTKDDYTTLTGYINSFPGKKTFDRSNADELRAELKRAKIVSSDEFPSDVVRLNSRVKIKLEDKNEIIELILVTPDKANSKEKKISVLAPVGVALIGFPRGQKIKWKVPAGNRIFTIIEVIN